MGIIVLSSTSNLYSSYFPKASQSTNNPKNKPDDVGENKMSKKPLAILLVVLFVLSVTASAVSAMPYHGCYKTNKYFDSNQCNKMDNPFTTKASEQIESNMCSSCGNTCQSCDSGCTSDCDSCDSGACDSGSSASCDSGCSSGCPSYGSGHASNYDSCGSGSCDSCSCGSCGSDGCGSCDSNCQ